MKNINKMVEDGFIWVLMAFSGAVNTTQTILTLLRFVKVKLEQELGRQTLVNITMHLMVNLVECGELEEGYQANYVV